jgi:hypothetical protein
VLLAPLCQYCTFSMEIAREEGKMIITFTNIFLMKRLKKINTTQKMPVYCTLLGVFHPSLLVLKYYGKFSFWPTSYASSPH